MGARTKLNAAYFTGAFVIAAAVGVTANSWLAFIAVAVVLLAASWIGGDIRAARENKPRK